MHEAATLEYWQHFKSVYLISIWFEAMLYGIYIPLFFATLCIMCKRSTADRAASKVFLIGITTSFLLISVHALFRLRQLNFAYSVNASSNPRETMAWMQDMRRWDEYTVTVISPVVRWIGEFLMIYRCYLVWGRNYYVVILPSLISLASIGVTAINLHWFRDPTFVPFTVISNTLRAVYPLNCTNSVITTFLITYKIWMGYRSSKKLGLYALSAGGSTMSLLLVIRIVVESAAIYNLLLILLTIFHNIQYHYGSGFLQQILVPTNGIVFVLIAVRAHIGQSLHGNASYTAVSNFEFKHSRFDSSDYDLENQRQSVTMTDAQTLGRKSLYVDSKEVHCEAPIRPRRTRASLASYLTGATQPRSLRESRKESKVYTPNISLSPPDKAVIDSRYSSRWRSGWEWNEAEDDPRRKEEKEDEEALTPVRASLPTLPK